MIQHYYALLRFIQDRDVQLHDGTRLLRYDRYDKLANKLGADVLEKSKIVRVHPAFRIIALAEPPGKHLSNNKKKII